MEKVWVFIDASYFYKGMQRLFDSSKIDFDGFSRKLIGAGRGYFRTNFYTAVVNQQHSKEKYQDQQRFLNYMNKVPYYNVKLGRLLQIGNTCIEKGVDIILATDLVSLGYGDRYDTCILVSGDGDFVPAIKAVQDFGKHAENAHFSDQKSYHLIQACDKEIFMDEDFFRGLLI
jgi:uncharacterized LabA/DUF88 family protein